MHELEINDDAVSFAFAGVRQDIWHRLGQQFDGDGLMTADEAMSLANMNREITTIPVPATDEHGMPFHVADGLDMPHFVILQGTAIGVSADGNPIGAPTKIVGITGSQGAVGHADLQIRDRFELAEAAIFASNGEARWSTAGLLRDGRQGFATMEAPPTIIDPDGCRDIIRKYLTVTWSFDGSRSTELGVSDVRVVCANTMGAHDRNKQAIIKVKHTSKAEERMALAAQHWAMAQNSSEALKVFAERMIRKADGKTALRKICDEVLNLKHDPDASDQTNTIRARKRDEIYTLYHASTNAEAVGDNCWAAYQTVVEYFDWFGDVKGKDKDLTRLRNQFDGTHDGIKQKVAGFLDELVSA